MRYYRKLFLAIVVAFVLLFVVGACSVPTPAADQVLPVPTQAASLSDEIQLTSEEIATLRSLQQIDDYPLYTMSYHGDYQSRIRLDEDVEVFTKEPNLSIDKSLFKSPWSCSLFAVLVDPENRLLGRNFDWEFSPALLLFTDPSDGYASVTMVDIDYLGFGGDAAFNLVDLSLTDLVGLLDAPSIPFDGMNEAGLAIGMAAVPDGNMSPDPAKPTIDSLGIIREMLDHAGQVDEAVEIMKRYNVDMGMGPPIHYLLADSSGNAALVEFYQGEMIIIPNDEPWHLATNFLRADLGESAEGVCWRYDRIHEQLVESGGTFTSKSAFYLLQEVSNDGTQWSIVYEMSGGSLEVVMGRKYDASHRFFVTEAEPLR